MVKGDGMKASLPADSIELHVFSPHLEQIKITVTYKYKGEPVFAHPKTYVMTGDRIVLGGLKCKLEAEINGA
jgi:hypothetical protein